MTLSASSDPRKLANADWWKTAVFYQIYPASFADSNGDGVGDLAGIISHLDYLVDLEVDALWLAPFYPTSWDDGGYDIRDYQNVDSRFGALETFDALIREAHNRGLKVITDLVVNHTSDEHPWFIESRRDTSNARRDWYIWRPPRYGLRGGEQGAEPTNWLSEFDQSAWQFDRQTGEYYLHVYSRKQPDLNWENPAVREAIYEMMRWWLERGVDGFRMDTINKISKKTPLVDAVPIAGQEYASARSEYVNGPRVHEFLQEMHRDVLSSYGPGVVTIGETNGVTIEDARLFTDPSRAELDMLLIFNHVRVDHADHRLEKLPLNLVKLKVIMSQWQEAFREIGWNSLYWCNHDQPRIVSRWGDEGPMRVRSATAWATVLHLQHGTPFIYQGEEIGMTNYPFSSIDDVQDIRSLNYSLQASGRGKTMEEIMTAIREMGRDNARTPMQWDSGPQAGFTIGQPWLPVNPNYPLINVAAARADPDSIWHYYRKLIRLRHTEVTLTKGDYELLLADHPELWVFTRSTATERLLVVANLSNNDVELPPAAQWPDVQTILANVADPALTVAKAWEARVLRAV